MTPAPALDLTTSLRGDLCSGAVGGNIRPCTKQRARHGSPFLEPPPPSFARRPCHPPPRKAIFGPPNHRGRRSQAIGAGVEHPIPNTEIHGENGPEK